MFFATTRPSTLTTPTMKMEIHDNIPLMLLDFILLNTDKFYVSYCINRHQRVTDAVIVAASTKLVTVRKECVHSISTKVYKKKPTSHEYD